MVAKHIIFKGSIQGVGFRFTAHRMAGRHQPTGYVRNLRDGTVEMLAQGAAEDIDDCIRDIQINIFSSRGLRTFDIVRRWCMNQT